MSNDQIKSNLSLWILPTELILQLLQFADSLETFAHFIQTCKKVNSLSKNVTNQTWGRFYAVKFNVEPQEIKLFHNK